jgi:chemotaxis protein methyltransferase CheR
VTGSVGPAEVQRFRQIVARTLGLRVDEARLGGLADVLRRRLDGAELTSGAYLSGLDAQPGAHELRALAQELTVPETYFFRHLEQLRAFIEVALLDRIRAQSAPRSLRVLSAGCASGEEPYSLAILAREAGVDRSIDVRIVGIDVNPVVLARAARGRFSSWALRETPADVRGRWFRPAANEFVLDEEIRRSVRFEERNLIADDPDWWRPHAWDVIFCRNVVMYLTPDHAEAVVTRLTRALAPGGYLFLGHAETLRGLSNDFHLRHTHGTFYYQRKSDADIDASHPGPVSEVVSAGSSLAPAIDESTAWVETIRQAAERIEVLTDASRRAGAAGAPAASVPAMAAPRWDLRHALDLLAHERFADALELVRALPRQSARDPDVLLLDAILLTHSGQLSEAEETCRRLLEVDELNAGAYYVLALCCEGNGDRRGAAEHDQTAVYLDPGFAMARLHLGLLARRERDAEAARRELGQALVLLQREEPARLLLFGGGFTREALVALCRSELSASEHLP